MATITRDKEFNSSFEVSILQSIFNHPDIGVYTSTLAGRFTKLNRKFCEIVGYSEQELNNMGLEDILFSEDIDTKTQINEMLFIGVNENHSFERRIIRKNHSIIWLSFVLSIIYDTNGQPSQYLCIVQDISERKNNEQELYDTKKILECIFDTTSAMIAYLDTDFNFIRVNKRYADAGNHPPEFYIGKNHFDLYPYDDNEKIFSRVIETGQPISFYAKPFEYKELPDLGVTYWDWDLIPVKNSSSKVTGLIFSLVDVTQRKKAEDELRQTNDLLERKVEERTIGLKNEVAERKRVEHALRQSQQRYREIFENTSDGIFLVDIVHDNRFKLVAFNPSIKNILGLKNVNVLGKFMDEIFPEDFAEILKNNYRKCIELESMLSYEESLDLSTGTIYVYTTLIPIRDEKGNIYRILGVYRDVTDQKKMSDSLKRAKEEAEFANNAKSEYIASMSHELRTPLNVILSAIQLFEMYLKGCSCPKSERYLQHLKSMKQNCFRLLRLINNLIDTTKIDTNFYRLSLKNYDIVNVMEVITLSVTDYVKNKNIYLNYSSNVNKKIIACDIGVIERIMLNLLSNAIKFTDTNGTIQVTLIDKGSNIVISVKDNGIGIPEDKQETIFERYKQVDQLLTRKQEGGGIGLSLTKSFVKVLGGKISVKSKVGLGSEFIVELPCMEISSNGTNEDIQYTTSRDNIIQKIIVELSDIYSIRDINV